MALHGFDELVASLSSALIHAKDIIERQHLRMLSNYFTEKDGKRVAKTITVNVPDLNTEDDDDSELEVKVPLISLVPINSLMLDDVTIDFDAYLSTLSEQEEKNKQKKMMIELGGHGMMGEKKNNIKISIKIKGTDPPEGLVKINDHILKHIP